MTRRQQIGDWYFASGKTTRGDRFWAWCAKTPDLGESPLDPPPHVDVYFQIDDTEEAALTALKREVLR